MRLARACAVTGALALLACASAGASDHLMRINEVALSAGGNPAAQYVELRDRAMQPFLATPYRIVVFHAGGMRLGAQTLAGGLGTASPYLVSSMAADSVFGTTADTRLSVALPRPAGQVCFTRGLLEMRIHCLAYGGATPMSSEGGTQTGPSPPDCRSLARIDDGSYALQRPTPNAANGGATLGDACPAATSDTRAPGQRVGVRRRQDVDRVVVRVRLDEAADLTVSGLARVGGSARKLRFSTVRRAVTANALTRVVMKLRRSRRRAVKEAIAAGRTVRARVAIEAKDAAGNRSVRRRRIRLTD